MENLSYNNIFEAIVDSPSEAADLKFRADMMLVLRELFESRNLTPTDIGELLGIPQPRVSELMRGKVDKVSSDKLITYLAAAGFMMRPTFAPRARSNNRIKCEVVELPTNELEFA